jgi:hypothetical protein
MKKLAGYVAVALGVVGVNWFMDAKRDDSGALVSEGNIGAFEIRVGDCFDDASSDASGEEASVTGVHGVPCSQPHDNEVYAVFDVGLTAFPEDGAMAEIAFDSCHERFESFVGRDYQSSALDILTLYPSHESWHRQNDREVVCAVYDVSLSKLEGTMKGRAL